MHYRLDYEDGDFTLVFPLSIQKSRQLAAYHQELRNAITGIHVWPEELDTAIFPQFRVYYQKIAQFFDLDLNRLTPGSRHRFFIATEPVQYKGQSIPGLSFLEKLLGYDYPKEEDGSEQPSQSIITTGDPGLDVITDALLIFKIGGLENHYSLSELIKLCKQANERLKQAEESLRGEAKGGDENLESEAQDEEFIKDKSRLYNWLTNLGVSVPSEF